MKKLILTALMSIGFLCSVFAQEVTFTIMKTDGTTADYLMNSNAKIYYSDTQLFIDNNGVTESYNLSELRKAYFTVVDNIEETDNQQLAIYPNPVNDIVKISNISDNQLVTIYSVDGKIIKKISISDEAEINVSELQPGLYIIGVGNEFSKFIKM